MSNAIDTKEEAIECAKYLLANRGYIVLRTPPWGSLQVGGIVNSIWRIDVNQPFQVTAETTHADFEEPRRIVAPHIGRVFKAIPHTGEHYYRAVTD
jgi:hypothetical protein